MSVDSQFITIFVKTTRADDSVVCPAGSLHLSGSYQCKNSQGLKTDDTSLDFLVSNDPTKSNYGNLDKTNIDNCLKLPFASLFTRVGDYRVSLMRPPAYHLDTSPCLDRARIHLDLAQFLSEQHTNSLCSVNAPLYQRDVGVVEETTDEDNRGKTASLRKRAGSLGRKLVALTSPKAKRRAESLSECCSQTEMEAHYLPAKHFLLEINHRDGSVQCALTSIFSDE